jgi:hypothetical protein
MAALLFAQSLGLMHRQVHGHGLPVLAATAGSVQVAVGGPGSGAPVNSWLANLFPAHGDPGSCGLFDQLTHGDAVAGVVLQPLPVVALLGLIHFFQGQALARWAALFDARGPPPPL